MALVPSMLAEELNGLSDFEGLNPEDILKVKATNMRFAVAITTYILTAQVVGTGSGGNSAGPVVTVVSGNLL